MRSVAKAEKLALIYRGIILSRLLYAVDSWWPYATKEMRAKIESLHYRACCIITGCNSNLSPHRLSVVYEAGFREFDALARDEMIKLGDRLRRIDDGALSRAAVIAPIGLQWVARLFRDGCMPTAQLRRTMCGGGVAQHTEYTQFHIDKRKPPPEGAALKLRDVAIYLPHAVDNPGSRDVRAYHPQSLRPLARPHPFPPHELALFDTYIKFVTRPPGGLIKPDEQISCWSKELKEQFAAANNERMQTLSNDNPDALFAYTDGSRREGSDPGCAGFYAICSGVHPQGRRKMSGFNILSERNVPAGKMACAYSGEAGTLLRCLLDVRDNADKYFRDRGIRRLVLVTDSKSTLESLRTTWLARIEGCEQQTVRALFEIAKKGIYVTLAFVFSHIGGVPGNDYVDKHAETACTKCGHELDESGCWHVDTTRVALRDMRTEADAAVAAEKKWRFNTMPSSLHWAPSQRMPRELTRSDEMLLFQARVGLLSAGGGMLHGLPEKCPFCLIDGTMSRGGESLRHLHNECTTIRDDSSRRPLEHCLWKQPFEAAAQLRRLVESIRTTQLGMAVHAKQYQRK